MNNSIVSNIKKYVNLSSEEIEDFLSIVKTMEVRKRQFIVQPNFVCIHQSYVIKGSFRSYFIDKKGVDHTIQFAIEDWFISDFNSYISQTPATLFVEALEDSVIQQITYQDVEEICLKNPKFERFFRLAAQKSFAFAQKRILSKLEKTAEERYMEFKTLYPQIIQRVPQYALASYLGMTPEFLSKIRKQKVSKS